MKTDDGFTPIDSGHIAGAKHDAFNRETTIKFQNGSEYRVHGMSPQEYQKFLDAPSQGEHFHREIKENFSVERVK